MAGQGVAGGQGGAETVLGAREVWQVAWGGGSLSGSWLLEHDCRKCA